jgi:hypothetical protein
MSPPGPSRQLMRCNARSVVETRPEVRGHLSSPPIINFAHCTPPHQIRGRGVNDCARFRVGLDEQDNRPRNRGGRAEYGNPARLPDAIVEWRNLAPPLRSLVHWFEYSSGLI